MQNNGTNVYVSWTEQSGGILFQSSPDERVYLESSHFFCRVEIESLRRRCSLSFDGQVPGQYVYVVWSQTPKASEPAQIYLAVSGPSGGSFSPAILVDSDASVAQVTPVIAAWGNDVYVAWTQGSQSWVASSINNGGSFGTPF